MSPEKKHIKAILCCALGQAIAISSINPDSKDSIAEIKAAKQTGEQLKNTILQALETLEN